MDRITVRQLKLETIIGVLPWERNIRQCLLVDLDIATDISQASKTDDLQDTINYVGVCDQVAALADTGRFKLIETLADHIAQLILDEFAANWVRVIINKVDVLPQVASVGVTIEREKQE